MRGALLRIAGWAEAVLRPLFLACALLAALAATAIVGLIGASVAMRYFANAPFRFTEEAVGLLVTAAFFLALPLVTYRAEHVRVTVAVAALPEGARRVVQALAGLFGVAFCAWFVLLCLPWLGFALDRGIKTEVARLLLWPWMALLPVSLLLTGAAFVLRAVSPEPDPEPAPGARAP